MTDREQHARLAWRASPKRKAKGSSPRDYQYVVDQWFQHFDGADPLDPTRSESRATLYRMMPDAMPRTWNQRVSILSTFFSAMRMAELTRSGVISDFRVEEPNDKRATYSVQELDRLLSRAAGPDKALVLLCADIGLRPMQVLNLRWADVTHEHSITVNGQSKKLTERADKALHALPRRNGYVFPYRSMTRSRQRVRRLCEVAGVKYRGVDVLRRWAA